MQATLKPKTRSNVAIKCFVNPNVSNSGLERYGMSIFDGASQKDTIFIKEVTPGTLTKEAVYKVVNGLDESAPELQRMSEEERNAAKKDIRDTIATVHQMLFGGDPVDPSIKNKDFWKQCSELSPTNVSFWGNDKEYPQGFTLELTDAGMFLDMSNPMDILVERAIRAGGYKALIAPSLEDAYSWPYPNPPKFYLDKLENTAAINTEYRKIVNKAKSHLDDLRDTDIERLLLIARNFDPDPTQYKRSTPADIVYLNMDRGIDGELWEKNKRMSAQKFLDLCNLSGEELAIRSIVKCATKYRFLDHRIEDKTNRTGTIYFMEDGVPVGRTVEDAVQFLKNPLNQDILKRLKAKVDNELNN